MPLAPGRVIRCTSARGRPRRAIRANYRALAALPGAARPRSTAPPAQARRAARHHRGRQGQRLRPRRRAGGAGAGRGRRAMAGGGRHRRRHRAARGGHRAAGSWCSARSASATSTGVFTHDLTPTISSPGAARALAGRRGRARHAAALSPEDRHRHEPPRVPPRQPARARCPSVLASPTLDIEAVYTHFATADEPEHALFEQQRTRFDAALRRVARARAAAPRIAHAANSAALPARLARLVRLRAARAAALRRRAAAAGVDAAR